MARGGARKGAGRPKNQEKKVTVSFWVSERTRSRLRELRANGYDTSVGLETVVEEWYKDLCSE